MNVTNSKKTASNASRTSGQQLSQAKISNTTKQSNIQVGGTRSKQASIKKGSSATSNIQQQLNIPLVNAPTSLTNLAQLSGITLHPISSMKSSTTIINNQQKRNKSDELSSFNLDHRQANFDPSTIRQKPPKLRHVPFNQDLAIRNQQSTSSISSVQSLQFINQATNISVEKNKHWLPTSSNSNNMEISSKDIFSTQMQSRFSSTPTNPKLSNQGSKFRYNHTSNIQTNDIQVIPVPEDLPLYSNAASIVKPTSFSCSYEDTSGLSRIENHSVDVDEDLNNISLIKLMAILNNPALTITAVGNPQDNVDPSHDNLTRLEGSQPCSSMLNISEVVLSNVPPSLTSHIQPKADTLNNNSNIDDLQVNDVKTFLKTRKSPYSSNNPTSNQGNARPKRPTVAASNRAMNITQAFHNQEPNQTDLQLDWFTGYTSNDSTNNEASSTFLSWPNELSLNTAGEERDFFLHDKLNDPMMLSTSVRNLMMQQLPTDSKRSTVSVQLLKHIANQTKDNDWSLNQSQEKNIDHGHKSILEPECILSVSRNLPELNLGAKYLEREEVVTSEPSPKKKSKQPIQTSKNRLFLPRSQGISCKKKKIVSEPNFNLREIDVSVLSEREVFVSDQYLILDNLAPQNDTQLKNKMHEPDEIFINRSKRVMSRIDTMLERKKRRRFERISGRSAPKSSSLEIQCAESEDEWSSDESVDLNFANVVETQLPLREVETDDKRDHLISVGLVSRVERNKLLVERYEEKAKIFSPIAKENSMKIDPEVKRFVNTMLKTGGIDVQFRTDTNIKRNDLPLIEGLNRNTSRVKMSYMNTLGLEKRSKRTTLYKVKHSDNSNNISTKTQTDLNKMKSSMFDRHKVEPDISMQVIRELTPENTKVMASKLKYLSCREAMKPLNKNEYMKSLGLMAS